MISIILSSTNRLYLSESEAGHLTDTLHQELICRTTDQATVPVVVADICLTVAEAWRLVDRLDTSNDEIVDWSVEGF